MTPYQLYIFTVAAIGLFLACLLAIYAFRQIHTNMYVNKQIKNMDKHVPPNQSER